MLTRQHRFRKAGAEIVDGQSTAQAEVFPFGQPVLHRPASATNHRDLYVLGAYPSGLHVQWSPPTLPGQSLTKVQALIVDNEPVPFWDGTDAEARFQMWKEAIRWRMDWGEVGPAAPGYNGPSGRWVDEHVLAPLKVERDTCCLSDCLDTARLNGGQAKRVEDTYNPVADALGLAPCTLQPVPGGEAGIVREAKQGHLDRLRNELRDCQPSLVVTLGNAALRVAATLLEDVEPHPGPALTPDQYGLRVSATLEGRPIEWLPLVHPRSGDRTPPWPEVHAAWQLTQ